MLQQLLNYIECYLVTDCSLQDLETWLLSNLQKILDTNDAKAIEMANQLDADLVELREGLIDETTMRERLEGLIRLRETVVLPIKEECLETILTSSPDETIVKQWHEPMLVENLRLNLVFS